MTRHTGRCLDLQNVFGGQQLPVAKPEMDRRLRHAEQTRGRILPACLGYRINQGRVGIVSRSFVCGSCAHERAPSCMPEE